MSLQKHYVCEKCDYSIFTDDTGHYGLKSGEYYNFKCPKCRDIISLSSGEIAHQGYHIQCPNCGNDENLSTWNPVEGKCPRCGGNMIADGNYVFMD